MNSLTVLGHAELISLFKDDLRYLTTPAPDAQLTMAGLKNLRPVLAIASLCPFNLPAIQAPSVGWSVTKAEVGLKRDGSEKPLLPNQAWGQWMAFRAAVENSPSFKVVESLTEIDKCNTDQIQLLLHLEGANPIEKPADLAQFVAMGGRAISLTWNDANQYAGGVGSEIGLTPAGKELLKNIEAAQILLDVSHLNEKSFWEVLENFEGTVFASHSNHRGVAESPRNLDRRQLHALRGRKAWVGVSFARSHLTTHEISTLDDVVAHLEALATDLGPELVGIGSDWGGVISSLPKDFKTVGDLPNLWDALRRHNWSDEQIRGVQGENFVMSLRGMK